MRGPNRLSLPRGRQDLLDKKGSFVLRSAEYGVPIFLDSGSNHSFAMDLVPLFIEGLHTDTSSQKDDIQAAALTMQTQPQLNIFLGEGGPPNFIQTTAPTVSEILYVAFAGAAGSIKFSIADERTGGLSGSVESEAVTWGKYVDADPRREIEVGESTRSPPQKSSRMSLEKKREPLRLMNRMNSIYSDFIEKIRSSTGTRVLEQKKLDHLPEIVKNEVEARKKPVIFLIEPIL